LLATTALAEEPLVRLDKAFDLSKTQTVGEAKVSLVTEGQSPAIRVVVPKGAEMAGVAIPGKWDLSAYTYVVADVRNVGDRIEKVRCRVDNPGVSAGAKMQFGIHPDGTYVNGDVTLAPGQSGTVQVELRRRKPEWIKLDLFGMVCYPWGQSRESDANTAGAVDAANISNIFFYVRKPFDDQTFEISGIRAVGQFVPPAAILGDANRFFPFIDEFGQYIHADWATKTHAEGDLAKWKDAEAKDLAAHPSPAAWDQ
jgi:hypothetical protein